MAHCLVPAAEEMLDRELPVLDKGFVRLVDYMGGDARVVQAARVSYGKGTKSFREDAALIDHLLRNDHTSPFEQVILTFHIKLPIFVARQWIRHRTARVNEISGRYSVMKDEFYIPRPEQVAFQSDDDRQGRSSAAAPDELVSATLAKLGDGQRAAFSDYSELIEAGIARELARINLPLSLYTEWYWQIDLHNLFRFLALRLDSHAQLEIRVYAQRLLELARAVAPACCSSFENHVLNGQRFSAQECAELTRRLGVAGSAGGGSGGDGSVGGGPVGGGSAVDGSVSGGDGSAGPPSLEGKALERFEEKLRRLGKG